MIDSSDQAHLNPLVNFFKSLGTHVRKSIARKAKNVPAMKNTVDSVYVLYVLSSGKIDDVSEVLKTLQERDWPHLPLQL